MGAAVNLLLFLGDEMEMRRCGRATWPLRGPCYAMRVAFPVEHAPTRLGVRAGRALRGVRSVLPRRRHSRRADWDSGGRVLTPHLCRLPGRGPPAASAVARALGLWSISYFNRAAAPKPKRARENDKMCLIDTG